MTGEILENEHWHNLYGDTVQYEMTRQGGWLVFPARPDPKKTHLRILAVKVSWFADAINAAWEVVFEGDDVTLLERQPTSFTALVPLTGEGRRVEFAFVEDRATQMLLARLERRLDQLLSRLGAAE